MIVLCRYLGFLGNGYARVWNIETLDRYVQQKLMRKQLTTKLDQNDNPNQMAGNVMVNRNDQIIFLYKSQSPTDRPSIRQLQCLLK